MDPWIAVTAMVLMLLQPKSARSGRRRKKFKGYVLKNASLFPEPRQLVEAKSPMTNTQMSLAAAVSKKCVVSNQGQTDLSWVSSFTLSFVAGGPGSASVSTQASSGLAVADDQDLRESARQADKSGRPKRRGRRSVAVSPKRRTSQP